MNQTLKRWLALILFLCGLFMPVLAHEGEDHGDIRDATETPAAPGAAAPAAPAGPPRTLSRSFESQGKTYDVIFSQVPADPEPGDQVQLEFKITQRIQPPDPLLGATMTVEKAEIQVAETEPEKRSLGAAHAEKTPGTYGVHFQVQQPGTTRLQFSWPPMLAFSYELEVGRPVRQMVAIGLAGAALIGMVIFSVISRKLVVGGWVGATLLAAGAIAYGWWPRKAAPVVQKTTASTTTTSSATEQGIRIPMDLQRDLAIKIAPAVRRDVPQTLTVPGQIRFAEGASHNLHARFTSRITSDVPRVGDRIQAGQTLATLEEVLSSADRASLRGQTIDLQARTLEFATQQNELRRQRAELASRRQVAASELSQRRIDRERAEALYRLQVIPLKELQAIRTAQRSAELELQGLRRQEQVLADAPVPPTLAPAVGLQQYALSAPVAGVIAKVEATIGEVVEPSKVLFQLVDTSQIWVSARVPESDLGNVRSLGRARVTTTAFPGRAFSARYVSTSPSLDPETRTAQVFFAVEDAGGKLLEGMSAQVEIVGLRQQLLTVPKSAVMSSDGQSRVFVRIEDELFEARTIQVERNTEEDAVIRSGLPVGTPVVVQGAGALSSELARRGKQK